MNVTSETYRKRDDVIQGVNLTCQNVANNKVSVNKT